MKLQFSLEATIPSILRIELTTNERPIILVIIYLSCSFEVISLLLLNIKVSQR